MNKNIIIDKVSYPTFNHLQPGKIGRRYGNLTVIGIDKIQKGDRHLFCKCKCGKKIRVPWSRLLNGTITSCTYEPVEKFQPKINPKIMNLTDNGTTQSISEWAEEFDLSVSNIRGRLKSGCSVAYALRSVHKYKLKRLKHEGKNLSLAEWEVQTGIPKNLIYSRLVNGWTAKQALTAEKRKRDYISKGLKLTVAQVREIREKFAAGVCSYRYLAELYGVSYQMIGNIVTGKNWKHVK